MSARTQEDLDLLADAGAEARARFAPRERSKVRFGAKAAGFVDRNNYDDLIKKPAPAPKGAPMSQLQEEAARRRREQRERERGEGR